MTVSRLGSSVLVTWPQVPDASFYVLRTPDARPHVLTDQNTFVWAPPLLFDLTKEKVRPQAFDVIVWGQGGPLKTYSATLACPPVVYIAARGSGQNGFFSDAYAAGLGSRGARELDLLRRALRLDQYELPAIAVDYPAVAVGVDASGILQAGDAPSIYNSSVNLGVAVGKTDVTETAIACGRSRIVLFGYSQGAQVMGDVYAQLTPSVQHHVGLVILFADAKFRPSDPRVTYRPTSLPLGGIKGERSPFGTTGSAPIESWCWKLDDICQRKLSNGFHFHGPIYDTFEVCAANEAARSLDRQLRSR